MNRSLNHRNGIVGSGIYLLMMHIYFSMTHLEFPNLWRSHICIFHPNCFIFVFFTQIVHKIFQQLLTFLASMCVGTYIDLLYCCKSMQIKFTQNVKLDIVVSVFFFVKLVKYRIRKKSKQRSDDDTSQSLCNLIKSGSLLNSVTSKETNSLSFVSLLFVSLQNPLTRVTSKNLGRMRIVN